MELERAVEAVEKDGAKRRGIAFPDPRCRPNSTVVAPFTLASTRVTVVSPRRHTPRPFPAQLLVVQGVSHHHPFPVGYRARKVHFGREWEMRIDWRVRPVLSVLNLATGECFTGETPTKPWTRVCVSLRLGTRISGPQFFGSSDPVTMRALAALCSPGRAPQVPDQGRGRRDPWGPGTWRWAAGAESGVPTRVSMPLELAVKEFATLDGVGDKTAIASPEHCLSQISSTSTVPNPRTRGAG